MAKRLYYEDFHRLPIKDWKLIFQFARNAMGDDDVVDAIQDANGLGVEGFRMPNRIESYLDFFDEYGIKLVEV